VGLTTWKDDRVRETDVGTAKNSLGKAQHSVSRSCERNGKKFLMPFLLNSEMPVSGDTGRAFADQAALIARKRYAAFDDARKAAQRLAAEQSGELDKLQSSASTVQKRTKLRGNEHKKDMADERSHSAADQGPAVAAYPAGRLP
jgi:hypothetical protein